MGETLGRVKVRKLMDCVKESLISEENKKLCKGNKTSHKQTDAQPLLKQLSIVEDKTPHLLILLP